MPRHFWPPVALAPLLLASACHLTALPVGTKLQTQSPAPEHRASALPAPTPTTPTATANATKPPVDLANYSGQVLGLDGQPAAGVTVRGYLIANNGGGLVANNGGGVVANHGGGVLANNGSNLVTDGGSSLAASQASRSSFRLLEAGSETISDAAGRFKLSNPDGQPLNLEAVQRADVKAIKFNVGSQATAVTLQLALTGSLTGKVTVPNSTTTNFLGIDVFVPGTSYLAKTDANGNYRIANVPVGTFSLVASKTGLGSASADGVLVKSGSATLVPDLALVAKAPSIKAITPANGGPGVPVVITGSQFGATTNEVLQVSFGGAIASNPKRENDGTIRVNVPDGASSGDVVVTVGQISGAPAGFQVIKTLVVQTTSNDLVVGQVQSIGFAATDTQDKPVKSVAVQWSTNGNAATVDARGLVTANAAGASKLTVSSGKVTGTFDLAVHQGAYLTTLAGQDVAAGGNFLVNGTRSAAAFFSIGGLIHDASGNVIIVDTGNSAIRRMDTAGNVTTLAGGRSPGSADGQGLDAQFNAPSGIVMDADGNFLISDTFNSCIRKLTPAGLVTTVAGGGTNPEGMADGTGSAARFNRPDGLALDASGNLLIADSQNQLIRKMTPAGVVSTVAGQFTLAPTSSQRADGSAIPNGVGGYADGKGAAARFSTPTSLAMGPDGNLYIGDTRNLRIRKLSPTGEVTSFVGSPATGTDFYGKLGFTDGTGAAAHFAGISGLTFDARGNLYVADSSNSRVRLVTPAGVVTTIAGSGTIDYVSFTNPHTDGAALTTAQFAGLGGLLFEADNKLLIGDAGFVRALLLPPTK
jgi:sugar lactone lactonase YvrE